MSPRFVTPCSIIVGRGFVSMMNLDVQTMSEQECRIVYLHMGHTYQRHPQIE